MLQEIQMAGLSKRDCANGLRILGVVVFVWFIWYYFFQTPSTGMEFMKNKKKRREGFSNIKDPNMPESSNLNPNSLPAAFAGSGTAGGVSSNLMDKDIMSTFEGLAPTEGLRMNFLDPTAQIGVDTVSNSLRNASYDIRSAPTVPQVPTGPWQNSTIGADPFRRPLE